MLFIPTMGVLAAWSRYEKNSFKLYRRDKKVFLAPVRFETKKF